MANTDVTLVQNGDAYAVYATSGSDDHRFHLIEHGIDETGKAQHMAHVLMQAVTGARRSIRDRVHLNAGGAWKEIVTDDDFEAPTPRQRLEAEIANLRAEGEAKNTNDAFAGGSGGAGNLLLARADALQHALDVLTAED